MHGIYAAFAQRGALGHHRVEQNHTVTNTNERKAHDDQTVEEDHVEFENKVARVEWQADGVRREGVDIEYWQRGEHGRHGPNAQHCDDGEADVDALGEVERVGDGVEALERDECQAERRRRHAQYAEEACQVTSVRVLPGESRLTEIVAEHCVHNGYEKHVDRHEAVGHCQIGQQERGHADANVVDVGVGEIAQIVNDDRGVGHDAQ